MNRRAFFKSMIGGIAASAAIRAWPFRVFSFPQEIQIVKPPLLEMDALVQRIYGSAIKKQFEMQSVLWASLRSEPQLFPISNRGLKIPVVFA